MNAKRGAVTFAAGGVDYVLRLTTNAQCRFHDAKGRSVIAALAAMEKAAEPDMRDLRALFQVGLTPAVSEDEAGDLMDEIGITRAALLIGEAAKRAFPDAEQPADPQPAPPTT